MKKLFIVSLSLLFIPLTTGASFDNGLYYGLQNNSGVKELQEFLTDQGVYSGPITGNFYSLTLAGVKAFQQRENISPVSGYFGILTRTRANEMLSMAIENSNQESIQETGTTPPAPESQKTTNDVVKSLQDQIALLIQQIALLQSQASTLQQTQQTVQEQTQVIQQQQQTIQQIQQNTQQTVQNTQQIVQNTCIPNWQCGSWSTCANSQQTRTCNDTNTCGVLNNKPVETQSCLMPFEFSVTAYDYIGNLGITVNNLGDTCSATVTDTNGSSQTKFFTPSNISGWNRSGNKPTNRANFSGNVGSTYSITCSKSGYEAKTLTGNFTWAPLTVDCHTTVDATDKDLNGNWIYKPLYLAHVSGGDGTNQYIWNGGAGNYGENGCWGYTTNDLSQRAEVTVKSGDGQTASDTCTIPDPKLEIIPLRGGFSIEPSDINVTSIDMRINPMQIQVISQVFGNEILPDTIDLYRGSTKIQTIFCPKLTCSFSLIDEADPIIGPREGRQSYYFRFDTTNFIQHYNGNDNVKFRLEYNGNQYESLISA